VLQLRLTVLMCAALPLQGSSKESLMYQPKCLLLIQTLTNIPDLFSDAAGDRGVAFSVIPLPLQPGESQTILFIDTNKDGNLTTANDMVIEVMGAGQLAIENFIF
jgi:hypothetical protein